MGIYPGRESGMISFDIETYSEIDLKVAGSWRYAEDPSTDVLCAHWTFEEGGGGYWHPGDEPPVFPADAVFSGYNVLKFDAVVWEKVLVKKYGWTFPGYDAFVDTMHRAHYTNLPGTLDQVARVLNAPPKDKAGHTLMLQLCKPAKPIIASNDPRRLHTPESLKRLSEYCAQDTVAEAAVASMLPMLPPRELLTSRVDFHVNNRGAGIDTALVKSCVSCAEGVAQYYLDAMAKVTKGVVTKSTDLRGITAFCQSRGLVVPEGKGAMDKEAIEKYLELPDLDPGVRTVLTTRSILGKSSLAKFARIQQALCSDGRLRGLHEYYGAHQTGRWAGRIVQAQNLPRRGLPDYDAAIQAAHDGPENFLWYYGEDALGTLTGLIRPCFSAMKGHELIIGDYNAIEARVVAWLADDQTLLTAFRNGVCPYKEMASVVYGVPYDKVTKAQRQLGKVIILACGYGMGAAKFKDTASKAPYYITLTDEEAKKYVDLYRNRFSRIKQLWKDADQSAKAAIRNPGTTYTAGQLLFRFDGVNLKMRLPNGVVLWYRNASIVMRTVKGFTDPMPAIQFMGEDEHGGWSAQSTYGGKLVENCFSGDTLVLTASGWRRIDGVICGDFVWDGTSWVRTEGAIYQGEKEVGLWLGVQVTQNHLIHDGVSWKPVIALDESASAQCLTHGRDSGPYSYLAQHQGSMGHPGVDAIVEAKARWGTAIFDAEGLHAQHVAAPMPGVNAGKMQTLSLTINSGVCGHTGIQASSPGVTSKAVVHMETTGRGASKSHRNGGMTLGLFSRMPLLFQIGIRLAVTWTVSTTKKATSRVIYALRHVLKTVITHGEQRESNTAVSHMPSLISGERSARSGIETQSATTLNTASRFSGSWIATARSNVYDLVNCGPQNRFMVLTAKGPVVVHNCSQAVSRGITADALVRCEQRGLRPILTVHDEIVCELPCGTLAPHAFESIMCEAEPWAAGIPVKVEAFTSPYYRK